MPSIFFEAELAWTKGSSFGFKVQGLRFPFFVKSIAPGQEAGSGVCVGGGMRSSLGRSSPRCTP